MSNKSFFTLMLICFLIGSAAFLLSIKSDWAMYSGAGCIGLAGGLGYWSIIKSKNS